MNHWSNLLPIRNQLAFEHRRQAKLWYSIWIIVAVAIFILYAAIGLQRDQQNRSISLAEEDVQPIRDAEKKLISLQSEALVLRQVSTKAESLQLKNTPLALLQSVGTCCQDLGGGIQIDSFRMDEIAGSALAQPKSPMVRKQLLVVGSAEADFLVTNFVGRLSNCGVFRKVELESSLAVADRNSAKRTFQIRCQQ